MLIKSALRDLAFCVIWHEKHSADWLAALASPYPAAPDFPRKRGQNKTPRNTLFINGSTVSKGYSATACGGKVVAPATKGGNCISSSGARLACFPTPAGRLYGFRRQRRYKNWRRRRRTSPYYITPEGESPQPACKAKADHRQNPWRPGPKARRRHQPSPAKAGVNLREYSFSPPMSKRSLSPSQQRWLSGSHLPVSYRSRPVPVRTWPLPER